MSLHQNEEYRSPIFHDFDQSEIVIVKRNNKKDTFQPEKIAVAIKKGFDSITNSDYSAADSHFVFLKVMEQIEVQVKESPQIAIEEIQDIIEKQLLKQGYDDVYESFSQYRLRRNESRRVFFSKQHKFLKAIEQLTIKDAAEEDSKRENANINGDGAMGMMLQYGSTIAKEFSKSYLVEPTHAAAHDSGQIHIHDMDFLPMGTTTCSQIDLEALFKNGFSTGHGHLRKPKDIMAYTALAAIAIQSNQNDQHGGQSIPAFDYYMAPGVLNTFKRQFKQIISDQVSLNDVDLNMELLVSKVDDLTTIDFDLSGVHEDFPSHLDLFTKAKEIAMAKTNRITYQAMEAFIHNLNTMHSRAGAQVPFSSINFGTDVSPEGRMVTKNYLLALDAGLGKGETPIFPISIFKIKEGVSYFEEDPNYDLFKLSCEVSAKRLFPNFSFIDAPFNIPYYKPGNFNTEITYMGCRTRVIGDVTDPTNEVVTGRGNLSFTSINLPRLGIKHGLLLNDKPDWDGFYNELDDLLELVRDQLLARFEIQANKKVYNFPFLMGQGVWKNSKNLGANDELREVLKTGTLTCGFIGLAECLKSMMGVHHGESDQAQQKGLEIVNHMKNRIDEFKDETQLNFSLIATPAEGLSGRFVQIDKSIFGNIEGITDREYYTNSFHIPVYYEISAHDKLYKEAPYHALTNAGHISYVELDGDTSNNVEAFMEVVRTMKKAGIGYGAINHPVDRDAVCGYTGIINDECPQCGRPADEHIERIRRITGYLVGTVDRFNNAKQNEEKDRVKHNVK
ncbi:MAG TPA: anaerobic ribonucleoside triphosphate reductase [Erysipelothrix sp.]|jgi:ribonucleoside-triphosphate reductase|nr:anaerobic ribonucleoside triphosphate reductase [Erysipelothrix sp.]